MYTKRERLCVFPSWKLFSNRSFVVICVVYGCKGNFVRIEEDPSRFALKILQTERVECPSSTLLLSTWGPTPTLLSPLPLRPCYLVGGTGVSSADLLATTENRKVYRFCVRVSPADTSRGRVYLSDMTLPRKTQGIDRRRRVG